MPMSKKRFILIAVAITAIFIYVFLRTRPCGAFHFCTFYWEAFAYPVNNWGDFACQFMHLLGLFTCLT